MIRERMICYDFIKNNIVLGNNKAYFLNEFPVDEYVKLMNKIMENMLNDLSKVTGLDKQEIFKNYMSLNEYDPIKEILKRNGKWFDEQSIVLTILERRK